MCAYVSAAPRVLCIVHRVSVSVYTSVYVRAGAEVVAPGASDLVILLVVMFCIVELPAQIY